MTMEQLLKENRKLEPLSHRTESMTCKPQNTIIKPIP